MPVKSGTSHAVAALSLTLLSSLLINYLRHTGLLGGFMDALTEMSVSWSMFLQTNFQIDIHQEVFAPLLMATLMAFVWGLIYHMFRHGRQKT